ncbi:hypothetical protein I6F07_31975 [Ensifer sp. IC4062]|nr:hypothetical protein [Ensifer sp. IC4062]MCA1444706.1 hypothetical protein [Ensifer sp. IC4062]
MFVRFRKLVSDGIRPPYLEGCKIACKGWCRNRDFRCPAKPRCRWRIGLEHGFELVPYRLDVSLAENRRETGRVKQEYVAHLGAIDAWMLRDFWESDALLKRCGGDDWQRRSIRARVLFWQGANERLKQLENRLGPDTKRIRIAVHNRVPWPKEPERQMLEELDAAHELKFWLDATEHSKKQMQTFDSVIATAEKEKQEHSDQLAKDAAQVRFATEALMKIRSRRKPE